MLRPNAATQAVRVLNNRTWAPLAEFKHCEPSSAAAFIYKEEEDAVCILAERA